MRPMSTPAPARTQNPSWIDRYFRISERGSTIGQEIRGGIVTFFAMSYILVLNPLILSTPDSTGAYLGGGTDEPNFAAVAAGTALVAGLMSILMGSVAKFPLAVAAGLGINALLAYTVVGMPGMTWADAMGLIVLEGILILVLVLTGLREAVFRAVPQQLKVAISVGIGLFIALVGLVNAGIVRPGGTPLQLGVDGSLVGWPAVVFVVGLFLIIVLMARGVRGAMLIGIVAATVLAGIIEAVAHVGTQAEGAAGGWGLTVPAIEGSVVAAPDFGTLGQFSLFGAFGKIGVVAALLLIFSILLADFFDTMGTMVAIGAEADLLDENGNPPSTRQILVVDSVAAVAGGAAGVSSNTSFIESAAGVGDGARTGLASVVTGVAFLLAVFLAPLAEFVPYEAATPALVIVGFLMMQQVTEISWRDMAIAIPAFLTIVLMPFAYSITVGIGAGFVAYVVLAAARKGGARKVHWLMWVVAALFVVYFALGPIQQVLSV
ncbi:putative MFS transporter, AGZA family, xanthine/uracil permease [Georgenia satyanarayanai]|uniref:Putative MFS transporter, AGZA family, xanthine/uracil permease n=2 Tax=Georgenia satyanarayanai TaxID=860221 RepID=A0A2Y9A404_9MICO|nr:AGZA family xanthine/uracil permease-like MFS transporter [Georgenia satyanarayanai]SSA39231.1 putative MFS transporter, AGZA family, xanthine/uracil permease [Georgenia satyanarayanai]